MANTDWLDIGDHTSAIANETHGVGVMFDDDAQSGDGVFGWNGGSDVLDPLLAGPASFIQNESIGTAGDVGDVRIQVKMKINRIANGGSGRDAAAHLVVGAQSDVLLADMYEAMINMDIGAAAQNTFGMIRRWNSGVATTLVATKPILGATFFLNGLNSWNDYRFERAVVSGQVHLRLTMSDDGFTTKRTIMETIDGSGSAITGVGKVRLGATIDNGTFLGAQVLMDDLDISTLA